MSKSPFVYYSSQHNHYDIFLFKSKLEGMCVVHVFLIIAIVLVQNDLFDVNRVYFSVMPDMQKRPTLSVCYLFYINQMNLTLVHAYKSFINHANCYCYTYCYDTS